MTSRCTALSNLATAGYIAAGLLASVIQRGRREGGWLWRQCDRVLWWATDGLDRTEG